MAITVRQGNGVDYALVASYNSMRATLAVAASKFHCDVTSAASVGDYMSPSAAALLVASANATDLPSSITLANELKSKFNIHFADAVAHLVADSTNGPVTTAAAVDLTTTEALLNALKTAFNAHLTQTGVHATNDSTNTVSTAAATDQTTSNALANALKSAFNAHIVSAPAGSSIVLVKP